MPELDRSATNDEEVKESPDPVNDSSDIALAPSDAADEIALKLIEILIEKFKEKTGNEPNQDEIENLLAELTEERIQDMLEGKDIFSEESGSEDDNLSGEENSEDENKEENVSQEGTENENLEEAEPSSKRNHSPVPGGDDEVSNSKRTKTETTCE